MKTGFTFIEILVVITIIALLSVVTFSSFFAFVERQDWEAQVATFKEKLVDFESQIQRKEIWNYVVTIRTGSGYTYETDKKSFFYSLSSIDFLNGIFTLSWNVGTGSTIKIENTSWGKYTSDQFVNGWSIYSWNFPLWKEQTYTVYVDGKQENSMWFSYYGLDSVSNNSKNLLLSSIWSNGDKTGTSFSGIVLKNFFGKKSLETLSWVPLSVVYLFFEKGGNEYSLTLP